LSKEYEKVLVLYVDGDGDIPIITKNDTPVIGRENNLKLAEKFALLKPEDSDLNALFYAIKIYDEIIEKKLFASCEIATISGDPYGGVKSDLKIKNELEKVLSQYDAEAVIFVSDGGRDELIIPIIASVLPVISVKRVVVTYSRNVEETYLVVMKYIKQAINDPSLSKIILGIPGLLLILYGFLASLNLAHLFSSLLLIFIGTIIFIKGFSIDDLVIKIWNNSKIQFISAIVSFALAFAGIYNGLTQTYSSNVDGEFSFLQSFGLFLISKFIYGLNTSHILSASIVIFFIGRGIERYMKEKTFHHEIIAIFFFLSLGLILTLIGDILITPASNEEARQRFFNSILVLFILNILVAVLVTFYDKVIRRPLAKG
jgi:Predicted membrane protein